jgi:hypothetical protein
MQLSERALKDQLITLSENDFQLPEQGDPYQRALEMMPHIGSIDSELRDDLIYSCLATWILDERELFAEEQLKDLLHIVLDEEHLYYHLGENDTDSVFTRSFSMLLLPLLLIAHRRRPYLTHDELQGVKAKILAYIGREKDLRGYVEEEDKGWAHAIAHSADALDDLAQCKELDGDDLKDILNTIRKMVAVSDIVYNFEEDERLAIPVFAVLGRKQLKEADVVEWLDSFVPLAKEMEPFPAAYRQALNIKNFLRSLYFRARKPEAVELIGEQSATNLAELTDETLLKISRF